MSLQIDPDALKAAERDDKKVAWTPVTSSNVKDTRLIRSAHIEVRFLTGGWYRYMNAGPLVYKQFLAAASKGTFVHQRLKKFTTIKLG